MFACLDVDYRDPRAVAAAVVFEDWNDSVSRSEVVIQIDRIEPYESGEFYRRELPCLLAVLAALPTVPETIIIDGYVWLSDETEPGLGAHLHRALGGRAVVIGVAKTRFLKARAVEEVERGSSRSPLFVTAAGIDRDEAARLIRSMHG
jgi:deoxyribonuclease V